MSQALISMPWMLPRASRSVKDRVASGPAGHHQAFDLVLLRDRHQRIDDCHFNTEVNECVREIAADKPHATGDQHGTTVVL